MSPAAATAAIGAVWFVHQPGAGGRDVWLVQGMSSRGTETLATLQLHHVARSLPDEQRAQLARELRTALANALHGTAPCCQSRHTMERENR